MGDYRLPASGADCTMFAIMGGRWGGPSGSGYIPSEDVMHFPETKPEKARFPGNAAS